MKKEWGIVLAVVLVFAAITVAFATIPELRNSVVPAKARSIEEAQEIELTLVYEGEKPEGVGSVQSFAITDDYFVIAGRPKGSAKEGGERDNQLILVSRDGKDVTRDHITAGTVYQLGHANGMTYNPDRGEIVVVGIRDEQGNCSRAAIISAKTLEQITTVGMPCFGSGISYNDRFNYYMIRSGKMLYRVGDLPGSVDDMHKLDTEFTVQDIGYHNGYTYLCNWVSDGDVARSKQLKLEQNQNVIYKVDASGTIAGAFIIRSPLLELESIDFANNEAYVLMNGVGDKSAYFYIYRVLFDEADLR